MAGNYQYVPGFYFKVTFSGFEENEIEAKFRDVSGIQAELEIEEIRGGGENSYVHRLPKGAKFPNLVLKRALHALPSHIVKWAKDAIHNFDFRVHLVIVSLLDEKGEPVKSWKFVDAYPVKIHISDLNATENSLVIETLELAYKYSEPVSYKDFEKKGNLKDLEEKGSPTISSISGDYVEQEKDNPL